MTEDERRTLEQRRAGLGAFLAGGMPALADFADRLGLRLPAMIVADPAAYLPPISAWMERQEVSPADRLWILARLGYFIGELLVQRFGGYWLVDEAPASRYFLRYVVSGFRGVQNAAARVDPFEVADAYLATPPGRDLQALLELVARELRGEEVP